MLSNTISPKEYNYVLMLEKWFLSEDRDLQKLNYILDYKIRIPNLGKGLENEKLIGLLGRFYWYSSIYCDSPHDYLIKVNSEIEKDLKKILNFKVVV